MFGYDLPIVKLCAKCDSQFVIDLSKMTFCENCNYNWISVKERLPKHEQGVLIWKKGMWPYIALFHRDKTDYLFLSPDNMRQEFKGATHWMPLPKPPKI